MNISGLITRSSYLSISEIMPTKIFSGPYIYDVHVERRVGGLQICYVSTMYSIIINKILFLNNNFCGWVDEGEWVRISHFCGRHKCMTPTWLNHSRPMSHLFGNQVVDFYYQNVWETPLEEWHFK